MTPRILTTIRAFTPDARAQLGAVGNVDDGSQLSQEELVARIGPYDTVVIGLGLRFDAEVLARASRLRCIATATTGLDHIDLDAALTRGITVLSLKGETAFLNTITSTAELALGLLIDLVRGLSRSVAAVQRGEWDRERFRGSQLYGKTLGIVGFGRLGRMMARYGHALGMHVVATDPRGSTGDIEAVPLRALLERSDVISLHVPYTTETRYLLDAEALAALRPDAVIINTSRGGVIDEVALIDALERRQIAGYATDVLDGEVQFGSEGCGKHPLVRYAQEHSNVIITPHISGMTRESRRATDRFIAGKVVVWLRECQLSPDGFARR